MQDHKFALNINLNKSANQHTSKLNIKPPYLLQGYTCMRFIDLYCEVSSYSLNLKRQIPPTIKLKNGGKITKQFIFFNLTKLNKAYCIFHNITLYYGYVTSYG